MTNPVRSRDRRDRRVVGALVALALILGLWAVTDSWRASRNGRVADSRRESARSAGADAAAVVDVSRAGPPLESAPAGDAWIAVTVEEPTGARVAAAEVFVLARRSGGSARAELIEPPSRLAGTTGPDGRARITVPRFEVVRLVARDSGGRLSDVVAADSGGPDPTLVIVARRALDVVVLSDDEARPIERASVSLRALEPSDASWTEVALTDADGRARFHPLPRLTHATLTIEHAQFATTRVDLEPDALENVTHVRLRPGGTFQIHVRDANGHAADARVWWRMLVLRGARFDSFALPLGAGVERTQAGVAIVRGVPRGARLCVLARGSGGNVAGEFTCDEVGEATLRLVPPGRVVGSVECAGSPVAHGELTFWPAKSGRPVSEVSAVHAELRRTVLMDARGRFDLADVPCSAAGDPEPYRFLRVAGANGRVYAVSSPGTIAVRSGETTEVRVLVQELLARPVSGVVTDPDGRPVAGARIDTLASRRIARTDRDGCYRIDLRTVGEAVLHCRAPGFARASAPVFVEEEPPLRLDFTLRPVSTLRGRVTSSNGDPLARVFVRSVDEQGRKRGEVFTDGAGEFAIPDLEPGRYEMEFDAGARHAPGRSPLVKTAWVPSADALAVELPVRETVRIEIEARPAAGDVSPPRIRSLQLLRIDAERSLRIATERNGRAFAAVGVPPGDYMVSCDADAQGAPFRFFAGPFTARAASDRWVVALPRPGAIDALVSGANGVPLPGATLEVVDAASGRALAFFPPTRTGPDGRATVAVGPGRYVVRSWGSAAAAVSGELTVAPGATVRAELTLGPASCVKIHVPVGSARDLRMVHGTVELAGPSRVVRGHEFGVQDGSVRARIDGLVPGRYRVHVQLAGIGSWSRFVELASGDTSITFRP